MSANTTPTNTTRRVRDTLAEFAPELADAADRTDDPAEADAYAVLAALGYGDSVPRDAARRIVARAERRDR